MYACDVCGFEVYQIINTKEFTPKIECPSRRCEQNQTKGMLVMQVKSSKFISYQEIKNNVGAPLTVPSHVGGRLRIDPHT